MSANTHTVFIFGAPDINLDSELENNISEVVKLEFYKPINEIHKYFKKPMVVRYLKDSESVVRCWGCHQLITDYAYPHNFTGRQQEPVIVLCCSHLCDKFIKYYKKSVRCYECECEFIPHFVLQNQINICPVCNNKSWSNKLKSSLFKHLSGQIQPHIINFIYKFMEIKRAINNNKIIVSELDT